uniref:Uncharacterized protein n=1 Tax=Rhizophora mucronata TaxID=61149 RepID=A0A2P2R2Y1_RHIMU
MIAASKVWLHPSETDGLSCEKLTFYLPCFQQAQFLNRTI